MTEELQREIDDCIAATNRLAEWDRLCGEWTPNPPPLERDRRRIWRALAIDMCDRTTALADKLKLPE
jgi:hypothetical protein